MSSVVGVGLALGLSTAVALAVLAGAVRQQAVAVAAGFPLLVAVGLAGHQGWLDGPLALAGVAVATLAFTEVTRLAVDLRRRGGPVAVEPAVRRAALCALALPGAVATLAGGLVASVGRTEPAGGWLIAALVAAALSLGTLAWALRTVGGPDPASAVIGRRRPAPVTRGAALAVVALAALVAAGAAAHIDLRDRTPDRASLDPVDRRPAPETGNEPGQPADDGPVDGSDGAGLSSPWLLVGVVVVGAVLLLFSRREQIVPPEDLVPDASVGPEPLLGGGVVAPVVTVSQDEVIASVSEALGFLRADLEPRLAVRCAYASVAAGLGRDERARRAEETEGEYLHRALLAFGAGGPALARLTELFAVARFSDEMVDERMRQEALEALEQVRVAVTA